MAKIIIFEEDEEPVVIETDTYTVSHGKEGVLTNLTKDGLFTHLTKLTFLAFMETLSREDSTSDSSISPQQNIPEEV